MRFISIFTAFLAISLSLLFINRLTITEKILTDKIVAIGGQQVQVSVSGLSSSELTVPLLAATFKKDLNQQHIRLDNGVLHFSLIDLIFGKIAGLSIDTLHIDLGTQEKKSPRSFSHQTIQDLLEHNLHPPSFLRIFQSTT